MTGYREDEEALRARVAELEGKLDGAEAEIARLRGAGPAPLPTADGNVSRLLGVPLDHVREVVVPYVLTEDGYAAISRLLQARLGLTPSQAGGDLSAPGFSLRREGGSTRIRIVADFRSFPAGVATMGVFSLFLPGLPIVGVLADIANHGGPHWLPFLALGMIPAATTAMVAAARSRSRKAVRDKTAQIDGTFEAILDAAKAHARPLARVRVADGGATPSEHAHVSAEEVAPTESLPAATRAAD